MGCFALLLALGCALVAASSAVAGDGRLEINQACALNTGCFPGDAAGFPVEIATSGSYILTGNLTVSSVDATAIEVSGDNVAIDMNGFAILGVVTCSGQGGSLTCNTGAGNGIATSGSPDALWLRNGTIRGMGHCGIEIGSPGARIADVTVSENGGCGIASTGVSGIIRNCVASRNGGVGIQGSAYESILGNVAYANKEHGIAGSFGSVFVDNVAGVNGGSGIHATNTGQLARGNALHDNDLFGLRFAGATSGGYAENVMSVNGSGSVTGGVEIAGNLCGTTTTCP